MPIWIPLAVIAVLILYRHKLVEEWQMFRTQRREWLRDKWKNWGEPFVVAAILAIVIRTFLLGPYKIPTGSMRPTFLEGDRIFVDKVSYRFNEPDRGDIIVFKYPEDKKKDFVKRLVGLSGDRLEIRQGKIWINGEALDDPPFSQNYYYNMGDYGKENGSIIIPENSLFAMGDNSAHSSDSRNWGYVPRGNVVGKAFVIWWPPKRVKLVE
ncbi:MAG: signal peptidase I [Candidatus Omnitrophota bacterium]|nr:signal peptidase I [Candidatus Omnitrophota bacterium]